MYKFVKALWRKTSHATIDPCIESNRRSPTHPIPPFASMTASLDVILFSLLLALPAAYYIQSWIGFKPEDSPSSSSDTTSESATAPAQEKETTETEKKPIMQSERTDLAPPKEDKYTLEELKQYDGNDPAKPIYVAIKGTFPPPSRTIHV